MQHFTPNFTLYIRKGVKSMSSTDIKKLVKLSKEGSAKAFGELYEIYSKDMYNFAYYYLGDTHHAQDAVSDAVCSAFASVRSLKKDNAFKSWLFTILLRSCQKQLKYIIEQRNTSDIQEHTEIKATDNDFHLTIELKEALLQLSEEERQIVLLSIVCSYKSGEIGEMLSMPSGTVRSKLSRATDKLYIIMSEEGSKVK